MLAGTGLERVPLVEDMIDAAYQQAMKLQERLPYSQDDFRDLERTGKGEVVSRALELEAILRNTLSVVSQVRRKCAEMPAGKWPDTRDDIQRQLDALLAAGFQRDTPGDWLAQFPRYAKALLNRVERLSGQYPKDQAQTALLAALQEPLQKAMLERVGLLLRCEPASDYRWMLEELRVSLFAQNLGTRQAVSRKRLEERWRDVQAWLGDNPH